MNMMRLYRRHSFHSTRLFACSLRVRTSQNQQRYGTILRMEGVDGADAVTSQTDDKDRLYGTVETLREKLEESSKRAALAERRVESLRDDLAAAEANLLTTKSSLGTERKTWADERQALMEKLRGFPDMIQSKVEDAKEEVTKVNSDGVLEQKRLRDEIDSLKKKLQAAEENLVEEKQRKEKEMSKLLKAEDELEFAQMKNQKERDDLTKRIVEGKRERTRAEKEREGLEGPSERSSKERLDAEQRLSEQLSRFESERRKQRRRLDEELRTAPRKEREMEQRYERVKSQLTRLVESTQRKAEYTQNEAQQEMDERKRVAGKLQQELDKLQMASKEMRFEADSLAVERDSAVDTYRDRKEKFPGVVDGLDVRISDLQQALKSFREGEKPRLQRQIKRLEHDVKYERAKLSRSEFRLEQERRRFEKEKTKIRRKIQDGEKETELKTKRMWDVYNKVRETMTKRVAKARSDARAEKRRLEENFKSEVAAQIETKDRLRDEIGRTEIMSEEMEQMRVEAARGREEAFERRSQVKAKFASTLMERSGMVKDLRKDVDALKMEVLEMDEKIDRYESNYREIWKLTANLTSQRLRKSGARVRDFVRRRKRRELSG